MNLSSEKLKKISTFIATCGGIGYCKIAPGSLGSLVSVFFFILLSRFGNIGFAIYFIIFLLSLKYGVFCVKVYLDNTKKNDPSEVIIDEFAGQSLAIIMYFTFFYIYNSSSKFYNAQEIGHVLTAAFVSFVLFRFFDITKFFPVFLFERVKGAYGVMLDDLAAGTIAGFMTFWFIYGLYACLAVC